MFSYLLNKDNMIDLIHAKAIIDAEIQYAFNIFKATATPKNKSKIVVPQNRFKT